MFHESWTHSGGWHTDLRRGGRFSKHNRAYIRGTEFCLWRWCAPTLMREIDRGVTTCVYLDADQAVWGDIAELLGYVDDDHAMACVIGAEGTFGVEHKASSTTAETSVMVWNLMHEFSRFDFEDLMRRVKSGDMDGDHPPDEKDGRDHASPYNRMMQAKWVPRDLIATIPPEWNHWNTRRENTKLSHWTKVHYQPWTQQGWHQNPSRHDWVLALREAMEEGAVTKAMLREEAGRRHICGDVVELLGRKG